MDLETEGIMSDKAHMPTPSAEFCAVQLLVQAHMKAMKPVQRRRFEKALAEAIEAAEDPVMQMQAVDRHAASSKARKGGVAWTRRLLVHALAVLDPA